MVSYIKSFFIGLVVFLLIDMIWLGVIAKGLYAKHLGFLMTNQIKWGAAILFYLIFVAGLVFFVIRPSVEKQSLSYALIAGAFYGLITYATYDLTNQATIKDWPMIITIVDMIWGSTVSVLTSVITVWIINRFQ